MDGWILLDLLQPRFQCLVHLGAKHQKPIAGAALSETPSDFEGRACFFPGMKMDSMSFSETLALSIVYMYRALFLSKDARWMLKLAYVESTLR